jgi:hypothetical protein
MGEGGVEGEDIPFPFRLPHPRPHTCPCPMPQSSISERKNVEPRIHVQHLARDASGE